MEHGAAFTAAEVGQLLRNPVVRAILEPLVFVAGEPERISGSKNVDSRQSVSGAGSVAGGRAGFVSLVEEDGAAGKTSSLYLTAWDGQQRKLSPSEKLRIAHPVDLYCSGQWHEYQKYLFDHGIRQPFKQVFRELYVKLSEEAGQKYSRMFAGNQIQPGKTVGCLRGRRWVADYEEGLQKIYY